MTDSLKRNLALLLILVVGLGVVMAASSLIGTGHWALAYVVCFVGVGWARAALKDIDHDYPKVDTK